MTKDKPLLLGIDLEDPRDSATEPGDRPDRVPAAARAFLRLFDAFGCRTTFFAVGRLAERHPELLREIAARGHEIAAHSHEHRSMTSLTADAFRRDLERNVAAIVRAGVAAPRGFRAPMMSMTSDSAWAYAVLRDLGFSYSSSVLPVRAALSGWPAFGRGPRSVDGVLEIPASAAGVGFFAYPFLCGVYFRLAPGAAVRLWARRVAQRGLAPVGYLHPYDADDGEPFYRRTDLNGSRVLSRVMYLGRRSVLAKLRSLFEAGWRTMPFAEYAAAPGNA